MENSKYSTQSETDRIFNVLDEFSQDAKATQSSQAASLSESEQPVLAMSSLGKLGRFGNQLFQYAYLRICAQQSHAQIQCPTWIGQTLFGHSDPPISKRLPPAIEQRETGETLFDVMPEFTAYIEKLADAKSIRVGAEALEQGLADVDLWGFFQLHTRLLQPHKAYFQSLFQPVSELQLPLEMGFERLQAKGKTIVGLHIRQGDFVSLPRAGFTLVIPLSWWCEWLNQIWQELDDPVLFLCSDELDRVLPAFAAFHPITKKDLQVQLPDQMQDANIDFYVDFFMLSHCDVVGISNSIFSFAACLLNNHGKHFVRPCWDFSKKLIPFDPWDSDPLLYAGSGQPRIFKRLSEVLHITFVTQGPIGLLQCLCFYLPKTLLKEWAVRAYLAYQVEGLIGMIKTIFPKAQR